MLKKLFIVISLAFASQSGAQTAIAPKTTNPKTIIAYCNYDSLLKVIPGYKESSDSVISEKSALTEELVQLKLEQTRLKNEYDSLNSSWQPLIKQVKLKYIEDQKQYVKQREKWINTIESDRLTKYDVKLTDAIQKIAKSKNCNCVLDSKNSGNMILWTQSGINYVDITREICVELGISK